MNFLKCAVISTVPMMLLSLPSSAQSAASMDFTNFNFSPITGPNVSGGIIGSVYKATNVANLGGAGGVTLIDALFTVNGASVDSGTSIFFDNNSARGDDVRIRFRKNSPADIWAKVSISFVKSGTSDSVDVAAVTNTALRLQFDDLDSDVGSDRADFAGLLTSQIDGAELAINTDLILNTTLSTGYTVGVYPAPYDSKGNVTSTDPVAQSPVTAAFDTRAAVLQLVLGVTGPANGNRHIDIDMTPDFVIVPEPSSALLCGLASFLALRRRRS